jgi:choline dehydrogenase-like flavoprotein
VRHVDVLVVGSGAGGATTASTLSRAGLEVLVVEEGPQVQPGTVAQFSQEQMRRQYRNAGQLVALGLPAITYAEGRCVGGSTEINSGLYHRPSDQLLRGWSSGWQIEGLTSAGINSICAAVERNLTVSSFDGAVPPASQFLADGATALDWKHVEVPRWFRHDTGQRQSMAATYLRDLIVEAGVWVRRLEVRAGRAVAAELEHADGRSETVTFDAVFVCAGAVQSPALLLRSGIRTNVGRTLTMHPTVKAVAFSPRIETDPQDVPVTQVREFAPDMTIGGSATNPPLLALALLQTAVGIADVAKVGGAAGIYYAAIRSAGRGRIRVLPGLRDPIVSFQLPGPDFQCLRAAMGRLLLVLLAAGSDRVVPSMKGATEVHRPDQIPSQIVGLTRRNADVMTVHICSSVPMGEDRALCAVNSYGASHEVAGVYVNDASIVNGAPGINPQGTVMALAIRNAEQYLQRHGVAAPPREIV